MSARRSRISLPWILQLFLITGLTFTTGCGIDDQLHKPADLSHVEDDHSDHADHENETPDVEACEHLAEGPAVAVQASAPSPNRRLPMSAPPTRATISA